MSVYYKRKRVLHSLLSSTYLVIYSTGMDAFSVLHTDWTNCSGYVINVRLQRSATQNGFLIIKIAKNRLILFSLIILPGYTSVLLSTNNKLKLVVHFLISKINFRIEKWTSFCYYFVLCILWPSQIGHLYLIGTLPSDHE